MALVGTINAPNDFGFKNRIINGGMQIDQRNSGASVTVGSSGASYCVDRFYGQASAASKFTLQRSTDVPTGQGFLNSLVATSSSAYSLGASDYFILRQAIEGTNCFDFMFGSSSARTVTLSFWAKSSLTGTFSGHLTNSTSARWYPFTYTISSANTWQQISITIPGDQSGTWTTDTGTSIYVAWSMGTGASSETTANAWTASTGIAATGAVDLVATSGATFYITGVQLEKGSVATPFDYRPYTKELQLCQRYYLMINDGTLIGSGYLTNTLYLDFPVRWPVTMRGTPNVTKNGTWNVSGSNGQPTISLSGPSGCSVRITATATGQVYATLSGGSSSPSLSADIELT